MNQHTQSGLPFGLSKREYITLQELFKDKPISDVAKKLKLSMKTIATYKYRAFKKMGVNSIMGAYHKLNPENKYCSLCQSALDQME